MSPVQGKKSILSQPFPLLGTRRAYQSAAWISLFVTLFLLAFRPFGMHHYAGWQLMRAVGFGLCTGLAMTCCTFILSTCFPAVYREEKWRVYHQLGYYLFVVVVVSIFNAVFAMIAAGVPFSWSGFLDLEIAVVLIGIIPIAAIVMAKYFILLKKNLREAEALSKNLNNVSPGTEKKHPATELITLLGENEKEKLSLQPLQLLVMKAEDNYVEVYWDNAGASTKALLRNTLQNIEHQVGTSDRFLRCHRSYLVNMDRVNRIDGNSQGYLLVVDLLKDPVPVSRLRNKELKEWIQKSPKIPNTSETVTP